MHYKNGREVCVGDKFVGRDSFGTLQAGTAIGLSPGATTCNIQFVPVGANTWSATASECLHIDDVMAAEIPMPAALIAPPPNGSSGRSDYYVLAGQMYSAYSEAVGGKAFNGDPLPSWEEFFADPNKTVQKDGWLAAAAAAIKDAS